MEAAEAKKPAEFGPSSGREKHTGDRGVFSPSRARPSSCATTSAGPALARFLLVPHRLTDLIRGKSCVFPLGVAASAGGRGEVARSINWHVYQVERKQGDNNRQYRNHVIQYKPPPSLRLFPPRQVAQVKRTEGTCRAAGWTLQSWPAVHLSTRGKSRPQGAFSSVQMLLVECDMGI